MTNLSERLDKHLQNIRERFDTYEGVEVLVNPSIKELSAFCKQNKETYGITLTKLDNGKPVYQNILSLFFNKKDGGKGCSEFAINAIEKIFHLNSWPNYHDTEFVLDANMNSKYCSAFSFSHDFGLEYAEAILVKPDGIVWGNFINNICNKFGIKLSNTDKKVVNNWLHGKYSDGEEIPDNSEYYSNRFRNF